MGAAARALTPFRAPRKPVRCPGRDHADAALRRLIPGSFVLGKPGYLPSAGRSGLGPSSGPTLAQDEPDRAGSNAARPAGPSDFRKRMETKGLGRPRTRGGHRFRFLAHGQAKRMCLCPRRCGGCAPRHPAAMVTLTTALSGLQDPIPSKADRLLADQTRKRHGSTASCSCVSCAEEFLPQRRSEPLSGARCRHLPRRARKHSQAGRASLSP